MKSAKSTAPQLVITQEQKQNDPFIRTTSKKIRNITKKITDIQALEGRADLKPEQVQKVKSKTGLQDEKKKYEQFIKFYKTVGVENAAQNKAQINPDYTRISQLLVFSHILAVNPDGRAASTLSQPELKIVNSLVKDAKTNETLGERSLRISQTIKTFMENPGLVSKIQQLFSDATFNSQTFKAYSQVEPLEIKEVKKEVKEVKQTPKEPAPTPAPQPAPTAVKVQPKVEAKPQVKPEPKVVEQPKVVKNTVAETKPQPPVATKPQEVVPPAEKPAEKEVKDNKPSEPSVPVVKEDQEKGAARKENQQERGEKGGYRGSGKYRPREEGGGYRGKDSNYRGGEERPYKTGYREGKKPSYRPKEDQKDDRSDTSLESSTEKKPKDFDAKEKQQMIDDGFIFNEKPAKTNKPKPKLKDSGEQRAYARKQHGYREKQD